jgi:hypothetical protein
LNVPILACTTVHAQQLAPSRAHHTLLLLFVPRRPLRLFVTLLPFLHLATVTATAATATVTTKIVGRAVTV